jgi:hypothetical protein
LTPDKLGHDLATLFDQGAPEVTLDELEHSATKVQKPPLARRPIVALTGAFAAVVLAGVAIGLITQPESPESTNPPATTPTTVAPTVTTAPPVTTTLPELVEVPAAPTGPFAVITADSVELHGATTEVLDIPDVRSGVILGDRFVFGLNGFSGVWVWPAEPGAETQAPGGTEMVSQLIGQTGTETSAWFHDAATVDGRELILFREIASETDPIEERMMILDVADGDTSVVFDKLTRRDDLTYEEVAMAYIGDAALTSDGVVALFGIGESTWIESYDLAGARLPDLEFEGIEGIILELDAAGDLLALGVEPVFPEGIQEVWLVDLQTDEMAGPHRHDVDGESLRDLSFDGTTITAGIQDSSGNRIGLWMFDGSEVHTSTDPAIVALP